MPLKAKAHRSSKAWFKHLPYFQLADTNVSQHTDAIIAVLPTLWLFFRAFPVCSDNWKCKNKTSNNKTGNYALFYQMFVLRCSTTALLHYHWFDLIWYSNFVCPGYHIECGSMQQWVHGSALFHFPPTNIAFNDSEVSAVTHYSFALF